jgi:hypothetical protein
MEIRTLLGGSLRQRRLKKPPGISKMLGKSVPRQISEFIFPLRNILIKKLTMKHGIMPPVSGPALDGLFKLLCIRDQESKKADRNMRHKKELQVRFLGGCIMKESESPLPCPEPRQFRAHRAYKHIDSQWSYEVYHRLEAFTTWRKPF